MFEFCHYRVNRPGHYFPGYRPITREGIAWLVNHGTTPTAERMGDPEFLARVDRAVEWLKAGRSVALWSADIHPITAEEYRRLS